MQDEISFGVWLRKQRQALDLTRQDFANQVGCAEVTLRRLESGTLKRTQICQNCRTSPSIKHLGNMRVSSGDGEATPQR